MVTKSRFIVNFMCLVAITLLCAGWVLSAAVSAANYQVNASVPYPAPSQAATINGNLDGTTVQNALQTLSGSCQLQNPADVVSVWRSGISIGSTACNGTYSLQVMLQPGDNVLTVRTANASQIYGPDSAPITITLVLPPSPAPQPGPTQTPTPAQATPSQNQSPQQIIKTTNAGAASDLIATTIEPFSVLTSNNDAAILVTIAGGQAPYTIYLDWGDGSTESHSVDVADTYSFTHAYQAAGSYLVRGTVRDASGAGTQFSYAVISGEPKPTDQIYPNGNGTATPGHGLGPFFKKHWKLIVGAIGVLAIAGGGYLLGKHKAGKRSVSRGVRTKHPTGKPASKTRRR